MINLKEIIFYEEIDDLTVEIFNQYKWALIRLGINFDQEILETIVYCCHNLEDSLKAFCAWAFWLKNRGEKLDPEILKQTLLKALQEHWQPFDFQEQFIIKYQNYFQSPQNLFWQKAAEILGDELRNNLIRDILEDGKIIFQENFSFNNLTDQDLENLANLKEYIANFF